MAMRGDKGKPSIVLAHSLSLKTSPSSSSQPEWHNAFAGCVAGAGARMVIAPLDLIRIRLQIEHKENILKLVKRVYTLEGGIIGFFRGNVPATYLWMGYSAVQFSAYERVSQFLKHQCGVQNDGNCPPSAISFGAGALAGITATFATYPLDLCRTNFAARADGPRSIWAFVLQIYKAQGISGFFVGMGAALYGIVPYMGCNFLIYEKLVEGDRKTTSLAGFAGAISGGVSKLLVYPLDTVKKRMQVQAFAMPTTPRYDSMIDCLFQIIKKEGAHNLYRGLLPSILKNAIATSLSFALYTATLNLLRSRS